MISASERWLEFRRHISGLLYACMFKTSIGASISPYRLLVPRLEGLKSQVRNDLEKESARNKRRKKYVPFQ